MAVAMRAARMAGARGEVPVGAAVFGADGTLLAEAGNEVEARCDASAHAELLAMRAAARRLGRPRLEGCLLAVTLEPCPMCAAAAAHFRIGTIQFAAYDPKGGGIDHGPRLFDRAGALHRPDVVGGVREREAADLLTRFFRALRRPPSP
ncbi:nucleoside deaminase [Rhizosaccharibacter radicis]|uniref:tRNA-specific adenosine deaminase n=1 Tax=Rhizosaccharibacter radicis TaxID=2782605 RepID=A0ABT1VTR0_9PROT|nr:nucleoside deaminase [Acetobacteraceae bacterium KSS12]